METEQNISTSGRAFELAFEKEIRKLFFAKQNILLDPGRRLRRHPLDELKENYSMDGQWLREEFERIINKKSQLSSNQRLFLKSVGFLVLRKRMEEVKKQMDSLPMPLTPNPKP